MIKTWQVVTYTTLFALTSLCAHSTPNTKLDSSLATKNWMKNLGTTIPQKSELPNGYNLLFYPATYTTKRANIPPILKKIRTPCITKSKPNTPPITKICYSQERILHDTPTVRISRAIQDPPSLRLTSNTGVVLKTWFVDDPDKYKTLSTQNQFPLK